MVALPVATMPCAADVDRIHLLRRQQDLVRRFTVPEAGPTEKPPELLKPSRVVTTRGYERWRYKLKGIKV